MVVELPPLAGDKKAARSGNNVGQTVPWLTSADRVQLARQGLQHVSLTAAILGELSRCNNMMHVPMPLGGKQPLRPATKSILHGDRPVMDGITMAKPHSTSLLIHQPINQNFIFNQSKTTRGDHRRREGASSVDPNMVLASKEEGRSSNAVAGGGLPPRAASVPLRIVDAASWGSQSSHAQPRAPLPPLSAMSTGTDMPQHVGVERDEALDAPSASSGSLLSPFADIPRPVMFTARKGTAAEGSVYATVFARSRSLAPDSKRAQQASSCLNSIAAYSASQTAKPAGDGGGRDVAALNDLLQAQLASYKTPMKSVRTGVADISRRPLDLR
jgi:hypothetical protein